MRILFLNQFFWPNTAATGQLLSDLAEHLSSSGHTVDVICGSANYGATNSAPCPGVNIKRLPTAAFPSSILGRVCSYVSFLAGALWTGLRHPRPDVVITLTTPPLLSLVGLALQRLRGVRHIVWEMDVYPDVAVDVGVLARYGFAARIFGWLADLPRRHADRVIALGECMRQLLMSHGIPESKIEIAENWAHCDGLPFGHVPPVRSAGLSILYSGNFGRAHDVETIAGALAELKDADCGYEFVFGGGGSQQAWLRNFCETNGVESVHFLPYCDRHELNARIASADIGLVTQHCSSVGAVVPSKSYGILAAGRPILYIGPRHSTTALMIQRYGCGWQIDCNDTKGLIELLHCLSDNKDLVYAAAERAYQAFMSHYQRSLGVARIAAALGAGVARKPAMAACAAAGFGERSVSDVSTY
jgi:colanic acid biosynthesis glycosyl transferase WcaI